MTIDLAQFHSMFFEESFEALDGMEAALLGLDVGAPDADRINTIFRVAHSIKGGSSMFAFSEVTSFTHSLETLPRSTKRCWRRSATLSRTCMVSGDAVEALPEASAA